MEELVKNVFLEPLKYRKEIISHKIVQSNPQEYNGKSFMCVFFTRFCGVGCPFCFFKSAPARGEVTIRDQFSKYGVDRFIQFCNEANLGYVLISGGGEPLNQKYAVLRTIEEVQTDKIVCVTSGNWAFNKEAGRKYLAEIDQAIKRRKSPCKVVVRVSVSEGHAIKLGTKPATHLIELFDELYQDHPHLKLQIHAFENDSMLEKTLQNFPGHIKIVDKSKRVSDDEQVIKVIPTKLDVIFPSGYRIIVGVSKVFESGLRPNLHKIENHLKTMKVFERDLEESEDNNSAVLFNTNGDKGVDWSLNYNGNICLWQNQVNDNQFNLYEDDYQTIFNGIFNDPLMFSYIDKGRVYRESIVAEVSSKAVLRMKSISLRDYSGTIIFEEEKTRLYYTIRVLRDFISENRVSIESLKNLSKELQYFLFCDIEELKKNYFSSPFTIVDQLKRVDFDSVKWRDFLELVKLGHYELSQEQIEDALQYYNENTKLKKYSSIEDVEHETGELIQRRLVERLMYMKPSAFEVAKNMNECELVV
jgi:organic radical activating enzyme